MTPQPGHSPDQRKLIIGMSGASGAVLGIRALEALRAVDIETHLVISPAAKMTITQETDWKVSDVLALADRTYQHQDIGAAIASGSFETMGMLVLPCSVKTLSSIANAYNENLLTRAADVTLKEGRPLLLALRETPLHRGHIRLMDLAAQAGAIIFPPLPAFYSRPESISEMVDGLVGRILARVGIENDLYRRWGA
ncbi:MAG: UbiX family flavin prenyltransferase [Chloroflexota bacterium]